MHNPFRIVLIFIALALSSLLCLPALKVNLLPKEQVKQLNITFQVYGASPEQTEQQATSVLENTFSQLKNLKKITSVSSYNYGSIQLYFDKNEDMAYRKFEAVALIRQIKPQLSENVTYPLVSQQNDDAGSKSISPLLIFTLNSSDPDYRIKQVAEDIFKRNISTIPGIKDIEVSGVQGQQININYDIDKLQAFGFQVADVLQAIRWQTQTLYPGIAKNEYHQIAFIKVGVNDITIAGLREILVVNKKNPAGVPLKNLATITIEDREIRSYFRINGKNAVNVSVYGQPNTNSISLAAKIKERVQALKGVLPSGYVVGLNFDDTEFLKREINKNYQRTTIALLVLLIFIFVAYQDWRHLLNLFLSLFVNVSLVLFLTWYFKIDVHMYTLAGIAIAFGIMIDHAIIMVDYYRQYRNRGVFTALLGATLTTTTALLLVFFLPEEEKKNMTDFALIITIALASSLVTNLWFTVAMHDMLFKADIIRITACNQKLRKQIKWTRLYFRTIALIGKHRKKFAIGIILLFGIPLFMLPERWGNHQWYNRSIGSAFYQEEIAPVINSWLGGTFRLFKVNIYEKSGYRDLSKTILYVHADLPLGNTIEQMNEIMQGMESYLHSVNGVDKYITNIYSGQSAILSITFKEGTENGPLPYRLKSLLTTKALEWGGVSWGIYGVGQGFSNTTMDEIPNFRVKMMGYNYDELERQAERLKTKLSPHKRVQKINIDDRLNFEEKSGQEYVLNIDANLANLSGTTPRELFNALNPLAKQQGFDMTLVMEDKIYPVMLKSDRSNEFSTWDVLNGITTVLNRSMKLKDFGDIELQKTSGTITKENRQYVRILSFEYFGSAQFGSRFLQGKLIEMKGQMPVGYTAVQDNYKWDQKKNTDQYYLIFLLFAMNFIICSILFENLLQPLVIIITLPISFIGLFLIFYVFNFPFDQGGYAAFIMLGGLVVNAGIFIVNDFNVLIKKHNKKRYNQLLVKATLNRGRTIVLTTVAAICGLIPFLIDGTNEPFWFPLAIGTIGGLVFSMFAVFIALPAFMWKNKAISILR